MINFDSLSLKALITELEPVLTEGRVQKVQQPSKQEVLISIRALGKMHKLYICTDPKYPHVALLSREGEKLRDIEIPQKPPMFCMLLRKYMEGAKINTLIQPNFERILEIKFDGYGELGEKVPMILSCEFMGKHSNIILYNYETNVILGCAHPVSSEKSRERELAGGLPYIYPPKQKKYDLQQISKQDFLNLLSMKNIPSAPVWLNENFGYISLALATEICDFSGINYDLLMETINLKNTNPSISVDDRYFSIISLDKSIKRKYLDSVNSMIDLYFGYHIFKDKFTRLKNKILKIINKEIEKQKKQLSEYLKQLNCEEKQDKYRKYADIIMANLYNLKQGADYAELEDIYNENKIMRIPLDKMLSPNENAQKYYKLYAKTKNAAKHSKELAEKIQNEENYLESIKDSVNYAENLSDLKEIEQELMLQNIIKSNNIQPTKKEKQSKTELTKFISSDGFEILLGKNNKQNDFLLKIACPNDIWLHVQNIHGSHVLIKIPQNTQETPEATLHEAVYIAAYYSQARESSNVPVIFTKKKFVKKPSGSKPGFVIYTHEKTLWVNPEKEKLPRLNLS